MSKVTVVGAGNVGATCADVIVKYGIADEVVLLDIKEGVSEGKAMDIMQTANILNINTRLTGVTNDYEKTAGSDVVVITSGIPRKPGMTREELIGVNAGIVKVCDRPASQVFARCDHHLHLQPDGHHDLPHPQGQRSSKNRIIGMGGALDSARFKYFLSIGLNANPTEVEGIVIGGHGDTTMIPLVRYAAYRGVPATNYLSDDQLAKIAADTMVGGATLTKLLGTSAWYAPGAAGAQMVKAVLHNEKKLISCSALLDGEYGEKDLCIGVPVSSARTASKRLLNSNSTMPKKNSSTRAPKLSTRPTQHSLQLSKNRA